MNSLATGQRSLGNPDITYPLWPPLTAGCPQTNTDAVQYPLEVAYDYAKLPKDFFEQPPLPGLTRWAQLLPPLAEGLSMGEGGTPLIASQRLADWAEFDGELFVKDESCNPTWSHKDRLNLCAISAAVGVGAPGVVVASSGNHGASASAYAARAGLSSILLLSEGAPAHLQSFVQAYGGAVVAVPVEARWPLMRKIVERAGYHPVSNLTRTHTGHPFGAEGYKTVAYEIFQQLGRRVPAAVFVPTGYAELLYGTWKGFRELHELGIAAATPRMVACEPASRAPLSHALAQNKPAVEVEARPTLAYSTATTVNGYRGVLAIRQSAGFSIRIADDEMLAARDELTRNGLWAELSSAMSLAALRKAAAAGQTFDGPVVCISTSSGFKNSDVGQNPAPSIEPEWDALLRALNERYAIKL